MEIFANLPATTVTAGGTDAPASGTGQSWTVSASASFPAASTAAGTTFHVADPANPSELIAVTNVSGLTWTVTRGAESTVPVAHTAGFTVKQVLSAGVLGSFVQSPGSGMYLCPPVIYAPASGGTVSVTSTTFAAFSSANLNTGSFVAPASGSVVVTCSFVAQNNANSAMAVSLAAHGSVSPLAADYWQWTDSSASIPRPYSIPLTAGALTPGGTYTLDLLGACGAGTFSVIAQAGTATTITAANRFAPVTITTQAV